MALYDDVFNKSSIYQMLFFNIKAVLIHQTLEELKEKNLPMYERWKYLSKVKHGFDLDVYHGTAGAMLDETPQYGEKTYQENAVQYPEFTKILAITYATLYNENGVLKRHLKKIANEDESMVIEQFMFLLSDVASDDSKSLPQSFSILCGHNIVAYDIPLLIKRYMVHRKSMLTVKQLPLLLKEALKVKPWESGIIDTVNVWKFNGFEYSPLMLIADFLGLKKGTDLLTHSELSQYYWMNVGAKPEETLEFVSLQSATQTNLVIQLMNELRLV